MRAGAFTTGGHVVFGGKPDLRTAAHEAAHVVQQRAGARPSGGIGKDGDAHERHADAVADAVVAGRSAEGLLDPFTATNAAGQRTRAEGQRSNAVQRTVSAKETKMIQTQIKKLTPGIKQELGIENKPEAQKVLRTWIRSNTKHEFKDFDALKKAVRHASKQPATRPSLFTVQNLEFVTKADAREATLYFMKGDLSGRIRQQHPSGPKVEQESNKVDYCFNKREDLKAFEKLAKKTRRKGKGESKLKRLAAEKQLNIRTEPADEDYHFEVTYGDKNKKKIEKTHASGGRILTDISAYDDDTISSIYLAAIGREKVNRNRKRKGENEEQKSRKRQRTAD
ncbi:hypothetical protein Q664_00250 [Archangium violaceum Cb vi76]|uniref:eCIS core domain-containing protein n=2 Tax=Archangium violaceum TaxID=83451 RepID=A0A084T2A0_9BACT|nr:hypothetical protein Q664_00250 [Archangium violaceum Cb vi76]